MSVRLGDAGEALAAGFLVARGLSIVERKFRCRGGEIDLIARDGDTLVFVEVRLRSSSAFGGAKESITATKRARMKLASGMPECVIDFRTNLVRFSLSWLGISFGGKRRAIHSLRTPSSQSATQNANAASGVVLQLEN